MPAAPLSIEIFRDVTSSHQYAGAVISGEIVENVPAPYIDIPSQPDIPDGDREPVRPVIQRPEVVFNPFMDVMGVIGNAIVVAALAMLLALFFQPQPCRFSR